MSELLFEAIVENKITKTEGRMRRKQRTEPEKGLHNARLGRHASRV